MAIEFYSIAHLCFWALSLLRKLHERLDRVLTQAKSQQWAAMTKIGMYIIAGLLFFELMFLTFRSMFTALFTFPDEYKMLLK